MGEHFFNRIWWHIDAAMVFLGPDNHCVPVFCFRMELSVASVLVVEVGVGGGVESNSDRVHASPASSG